MSRARKPKKILNPKTGALLTELAEASVEQVDAAVEAASKAFDAWARTTPAERSRLLLKLADAIESAGEDFATLEALNCGKPRIRVLEDEIPAIADCFRFSPAPRERCTALRPASMSPTTRR